MSSDLREEGRAMNLFEDAPIVHQLMAIDGRSLMFFTACKMRMRSAEAWKKTDEQVTCLRCIVDWVLRV